MTIGISWSTLVMQADPDHARDKRIVTEYEFPAPNGTKSEKIYKDGKRIFEADYNTRGPYST